MILTIGRRLKYMFIPFLLLSLALSAGCSEKKGEPGKPPPVGVEVGFLAPDFRIKNLKGGLSTLSEQRGKVVLMNFWATWCTPCRAEMPSMEALYKKFDRKDFEILAVSIDTEGEPLVHSFIGQFGFTFPVLLDPQFAVNDLYQIRVVPTSLLIDRRGVIAQRIMGAKNWEARTSLFMVTDLVEKDP